MPELRQNLATKEWVIIATERAKRPKDFVRKEKEVASQIPERDEQCPFCEGNEHMTPEEVLSYRKDGTAPNTPGWTVRVVPNKFAALTPGATPTASPMRARVGLYLRADGIGRHEVIIETPEHNKTIATMSVTQVEQTVRAYRDRYAALNLQPNIEMIIIFRNQGERAGTSLVHPHSQLVAMPIVPVHIRQRLYEYQKHYDALGRCVFCDMMSCELEQGKRMVLDNDSFICFVPYAATVPFEVWLLPRRHQATFGEISDNEIPDLARALRSVLAKLYYGLNQPDYNYVINTAPHYSIGEPYYHWWIQVLPRLTTPAGFEIGSGMSINVSLPEENAAHLREVVVPD